MVPHCHAPLVHGYGDVGMDALSFSVVSSCVPHVFIAVLQLWPRSSSPAVAYAGLVWLVAPRAVFHVVVYRPEMLCIMACLDQNFPAVARATGDSAPRAVILSLLSSGPNARHHGRYGPA